MSKFAGQTINMNLDFAQYLPENFSPNSRVWIYQSNRILGMGELLEADKILQEFVSQWSTHGKANDGFARIFFGQFIVLIADETCHQVSGCSTDASVRIIKQLESILNISLFDRQLLAFIVKDKSQCIPMTQLDYAVNNGFINSETLYFNNTILTKKDLIEKWIVPIKDSWLAAKLSIKTTV